MPFAKVGEDLGAAENQKRRERSPAPLLVGGAGGLDQGSQALGRAYGGLLVVADALGPAARGEHFYVTVPFGIELFEQCCRHGQTGDAGQGW